MDTLNLRRSFADIAAGLALLLIPFATAAVKFVEGGWVVLIYGMGLVLFVPLYILVVVIASTGFFARQPAFAFAGPGRWRARVAAWLHPVAFLVATAFLQDGGDTDPWNSPIGVWLGLDAENPLVTTLGGIAVLLILMSLGALVWLFVEWRRAIVARRQALTELTT